MIPNKGISLSDYYQAKVVNTPEPRISFAELKLLAEVIVSNGNTSRHQNKEATSSNSILSIALLSKSQARRLDKLLASFIAGIPLSYITGFTHFYGYNFKVKKGVLIPRQETEQLVDRAKQYLLANNNKSISVLEVGTGSGCIAISLAKELENYLLDNAIQAIDVSKSAVKIAKENLELLKPKKIVSVKHQSLLNYLKNDSDRQLSLIISNPPYLTQAQMSALPLHTKKEPKLALFGGKDGLKFYRQILKLANKQVEALGTLPSLILEADPEIMQPLKALICEVYPTNIVEIHKDLFGLERFITALQP